MELPVYNQKAENVGKINLPDEIFALPLNGDLLYQVVVSQMSNRRQVIAHAKTRAEVRGGGKKPWRQKGTGRARHGSIRSPIWKGGGVTFGPTKDKNFKKKINKKMARKALFMALSGKIKDKELAVIDKIEIENPKTREMAAIRKNIAVIFPGYKPRQSTLLILPGVDSVIKRALANLQGFEVAEARNLNAMDVLSFKNLVFTKDAIESVRGVFSKSQLSR